MITVVIFSILFGSLQSEPPDTLTLEYCYSRIENHYPLARKVELQNKITELNKKIANTASYPQLDFGASATYQSEVADLSFPSGGQVSGPELSKDQYKINMEISQSIYNGGKVGIQKKLAQINGKQQKQEIKAQLHELKEQLNEVYFGILLSQRQLEISVTLAENIRNQIRDVVAKVENGVLLPSQQYILEAELIKAQQDSIEIEQNIESGYEVLSQLIGEEINEGISLKMPEVAPVYQSGDSLAQRHPEFELFESNRQALGYQKELAQANKWPSLSAFGTAAYGRPGFNVFEDELHSYYIVGLRVQWNFWESRNADSRQNVYSLQQKNITQTELAFERQLKASLSKIRKKIDALQDKIQRDKEIINLRRKVVAQVSSQMKNGTATATEYITELNKATQARLSMMMHKTKLVQAKKDYNTVLGISNN